MAYDTLSAARYWEQMAREKEERARWEYEARKARDAMPRPTVSWYGVSPSRWPELQGPPPHNVTVAVNTPADVARLKQDLQAMNARVYALTERVRQLEDMVFDNLKPYSEMVAECVQNIEPTETPFQNFMRANGPA